MLALIREGSKDPEVIDEARRAVRHVRPHDYSGEIQAIWDYVTGLEAPPYRLDPVDAELLQGAGVPSVGRDCDCMVIRAGALFEAIGHPVRVVIGARRAPRPGQPPSFGHTWLEVYDRSRRSWTSFDPVLDLMQPGVRAQVGDVLPHAVTTRSPVRRAIGYTASFTDGFKPTQRRAPGQLSGLQGFSFKKLVKGVKKVAGNKLVQAIGSQALRFVPGGSVALTALSAASKGVKVVKALKAGGIKGALKAAAPLALDVVAPGLSQKVKSITAAIPAPLRQAAVSAVKSQAKKLTAAPRTAPAARIVAAAAPRPRPAPRAPAPRAPAPVRSIQARRPAPRAPTPVRAVLPVAAAAAMTAAAAPAQEEAAEPIYISEEEALAPEPPQEEFQEEGGEDYTDEESAAGDELVAQQEGEE
jgi:hypothetical protein